MALFLLEIQMKFLVATLVVLCGLFGASDQLVAQTDGNAKAEEKANTSRPFLGVQFEADSLEVVKVVAGAPADKAGFKVGDKIVKADGEACTDREILLKTIGKKKVGDSIKIVVLRGNVQVELSATLASSIGVSALPSSGLKADKPKTGEFKSADGLKVTVDAYAPYAAGSVSSILLCHQAGWSRGEYQEIAPKLNEMGFNCYAIDQRSGGAVNGVTNETNKRAAAAGKGVAYLDAEQDIVAALKYVHEQSGDAKVILWGSSYSAALSLRIAGEHPELIDGVLAFAPGEYFARFGKSKNYVTTSAKKIANPAFVTSAKNELKNWKSIYDAIPGDSKVMFLPETKGNHGSRALWEKFGDNKDYWKAASSFLAQFVE